MEDAAPAGASPIPGAQLQYLNQHGNSRLITSFGLEQTLTDDGIRSRDRSPSQIFTLQLYAVALLSSGGDDVLAGRGVVEQCAIAGGALRISLPARHALGVLLR